MGGPNGTDLPSNQASLRRSRGLRWRGAHAGDALAAVFDQGAGWVGVGAAPGPRGRRDQGLRAD